MLVWKYNLELPEMAILLKSITSGKFVYVNGNIMN